MQGILISIEGPDGAGKTTQISLLKQYLEQKGFSCILTREPGGTKISEKIRHLILDKENSKMGAVTEMLLYSAARAQLVHEVIRPALEEGKVIICDRYVDSSAVYQGIARNLGVDTVYEVNEYAIQGIWPDLTIHLDLEAEEGIRRKKNQTELDRMELETMDFHKKVCEGYRTLAKRNPDRIKTINAMLSVEEIHEAIKKQLEFVIKNR
ncbi:MAG: dTMP kinase [Firmicutes bacterium]|uniref:Thymidylate kinase n=1 Tax=Candidatus Scybalomonas excrementavium TaxID=2840943 RepID=A0A9D9N888_9FIRM|nr:dTMP kinase [Candidatus Scybalomonas excrementavium]